MNFLQIGEAGKPSNKNEGTELSSSEVYQPYSNDFQLSYSLTVMDKKREKTGSRDRDRRSAPG